MTWKARSFWHHTFLTLAPCRGCPPTKIELTGIRICASSRDDYVRTSMTFLSKHFHWSCALFTGNLLQDPCLKREMWIKARKLWSFILSTARSCFVSRINSNHLIAVATWKRLKSTSAWWMLLLKSVKMPNKKPFNTHHTSLHRLKAVDGSQLENSLYPVQLSN